MVSVQFIKLSITQMYSTAKRQNEDKKGFFIHYVSAAAVCSSYIFSMCQMMTEIAYLT